MRITRCQVVLPGGLCQSVLERLSKLGRECCQFGCKRLQSQKNEFGNSLPFDGSPPSSLKDLSLNGMEPILSYTEVWSLYYAYSHSFRISRSLRTNQNQQGKKTSRNMYNLHRFISMHVYIR